MSSEMKHVFDQLTEDADKLIQNGEYSKCFFFRISSLLELQSIKSITFAKVTHFNHYLERFKREHFSQPKCLNCW